MELTKLRENKKDDNQAITSVHEAGHAVLSVLLLNRIPDIIRSRTADANTSGFVSGNIFDSVVSRSEIKNRIAVLLGGIVAEELIFGESRITGGSSSDIKKATAFALESAKENGLSIKPLYYSIAEPKSNRIFHEQEVGVEAEAENWIIEAKDLAIRTLSDNESFLLSISDILFQKSLMTKQDFETIIPTYFPNFTEKQLISNGLKGEYVDILHRKIMNMKENGQERKSHYSSSLGLVAYSQKAENE
jgi:ATP-dependent Zn protease